MSQCAEKVWPPEPRTRPNAVATLAMIGGDEFDLARSLLPDLGSWLDYDDWRDSREGSLLGLAMAGVDARFVPVKLAAFLTWCNERRRRPDGRSLDAYAEVIGKESNLNRP